MLKTRWSWVLAVGCWLLAACGSEPSADSQDSTAVTYQSPVDYDITLAGNFGEPRPWHFHGGLDIKTDNVEGKPVGAIADGYVSRVTTNKYGFGNAIYVCHPDGHTSVYCHLRSFADEYEKALHLNHRDTLDLRFPAERFPVEAGHLIAISGNTGHSTGPHLHLEIHDTETWRLLDPLEFIGQYVADTVAPVAHSFMAVPVKGEGVFNGGSGKQTFGFGLGDVRRQRIEYHDGREFTAWGRVGFALWADDYAQGVYNHYGIRHTRLLVDGREVFHSDVNDIPVSCHHEVNSWGDYDHWRRHHTWYMKSYREEGMRLPVVHTDFDRGIVTFGEERPYRLTYILRDYQGNQSQYDFVVHGVKNNHIKINKHKRLWNDYLYWQQCLWPLYTLRPARTSS